MCGYEFDFGFSSSPRFLLPLTQPLCLSCAAGKLELAKAVAESGKTADHCCLLIATGLRLGCLCDLHDTRPSLQYGCSATATITFAECHRNRNCCMPPVELLLSRDCCHVAVLVWQSSSVEVKEPLFCGLLVLRISCSKVTLPQVLPLTDPTNANWSLVSVGFALG